MLEKSFRDMTDTERVQYRAEQLRSTGGDECDECGHEDYWHQFIEFEKKLWCNDCFVEAMEDEKNEHGESERYLAMKKEYGEDDDQDTN